MADARELARALLAGRTETTTGAVSGGPAPVVPPPTARRSAARRTGWTIADYPQVQLALAQRELLEKSLAGHDLPDPYYVPQAGVNEAVTSIFGGAFVNFSGYNYLGLAGDPRVQAAAKAAIDTYGTSCSASRVMSGQIPLHAELESRLASAYGADGAVVTGSGFLTNAAVISFLLGPDDLAVCDALVHNSIVAGTEWGGCQRMTFRHNDPPALDELLTRSRGHFGRVLLSVSQHLGLDARQVDVWMGTLSKSLESYGGFLAGSAELCEALRMVAPGVSLYAAAPPPPTMGAAVAAFDLMVAEPERVTRLRANGSRLAELFAEAGVDKGACGGTPVVPAIYGDTRTTMVAAQVLLQAGVNADPIMTPPSPQARSACASPSPASTPRSSCGSPPTPSLGSPTTRCSAHDGVVVPGRAAGGSPPAAVPAALGGGTYVRSGAGRGGARPGSRGAAAPRARDPRGRAAPEGPRGARHRGRGRGARPRRATAGPRRAQPRRAARVRRRRALEDAGRPAARLDAVAAASPAAWSRELDTDPATSREAFAAERAERLLSRGGVDPRVLDHPELGARAPCSSPATTG